MFGSKKANHTPLLMGPEKFDTLIGQHTEIHGCLKLKESARIDGKVVGSIEAHDGAISVVIGPTGEVHGDIIASRIIVAGQVMGRLHGFERVEIMASALVQGDVAYATLAVEHGARLLGSMLQLDGSNMHASLAQGVQPALGADVQEITRKTKKTEQLG